MTIANERIELHDGTGAVAWIRPDLGGWLVRYARPVGSAGMIEAIPHDPAVVERYPREMWAGNPILFPHVSLNVAHNKEGQYELNGQLYTSPQHGFARRVPWQVVRRSSDAVTLELTDGPGTLPSYPFRFRHQLTYALVAGRLEMRQTVENTDTQPLPFSTGIHPYLRVPLRAGGDRSHCHLRLPRCIRYNPVGKYESFYTEPVAAQNWPVARDVSGTLLLGDFVEKEMALVDPDAGCEVVINFADSPEYRYAAIWSRSVDAPFYCVEPWTALPNSFGRPDGELIILPPGARFEARLWMDVRPAQS